ncbi:MAG: type I-MYXAN CRISPR-associated protein Cas5/Cmx5/DevS [Acidobacteriota bacterium]
MESLWLHVKAPFAAFRQFQAGGYKATFPVMPPSAAYGLVLNLAGIEMRGPLSGVTTVIRDKLPELEIAVGLLARPRVERIFQQLHSYPVGLTGSRLSELTHGAKYHISPVRREILVGYDGMIGVRSPNRPLLEMARRGVRGDIEGGRYGLPFLGDNGFLIDEIEALETPPLTWWYARLEPERRRHRGVCRLTVGIDRLDNSRTTSVAMAPLESRHCYPPETGWITTPGRQPVVENGE